MGANEKAKPAESDKPSTESEQLKSAQAIPQQTPAADQQR